MRHLPRAAGSVILAMMAVRPAVSQDWPHIHGNLANQRYAALDQINRKTLDQLGAIWVSEPFADGATSRMTPLVHEGLMFFGAGARIYALDAGSGKQVWVHQTETRQPKRGGVGLGFDYEAMVSGLAITRAWGLGLGGGMIFAGMMNGHVIALKEKTGELLWDQLISEEPLAVSKGIVSPPIYVDGVLYFGLGQETTRGTVVAVEAKSGRVLWRTHTVPAPGLPGHETWPADSSIWRSGGGHPWTAGAADPVLGLVYFVTGNAAPTAAGAFRRGDNLYANSLIALDMKSGQLRWYRQLLHHDIWEADLSISPVLFDQKMGHRVRRAIAAMRGDGYLFLFDRTTGEPLIPIDERPVPQNPQLFTSPTQPFPRGAESILPPCESWRPQIPKGFVLGCMFDPPSRDAPNQLSQFGSVRVAPMSYNPRTGAFYAQGTNSLMWQTAGERDPFVWITNVNGARIPNFPRPSVVVAAIDARNAKRMWTKELPTHDDSGYKANGGALSTAGGLVFHQGGDGTLQAYDARTGQTLWTFQMDFAVGDAAPMSYAIDGKQYVALIAGSKVWAFALGGRLGPSASIPAPPWDEVRGPIEDKNEIQTATLEEGPANGRRYRLNEYAFNPYRARIRAGASITFINNGLRPNTIVARDGSWQTRMLGPTQIESIAFHEPGRHIYHSKEYPWAYGEIIVVPASTQATAAPSAQVAGGQRTYVSSCGACHGENLSGRDPAPALSGGGFRAKWSGRTALDLFDRIRTTMPPTAPASLSDADYAALVAYVLYANDNAPGVTLDRETMKGLALRRQ